MIVNQDYATRIIDASYNLLFLSVGGVYYLSVRAICCCGEAYDGQIIGFICRYINPIR